MQSIEKMERKEEEVRPFLPLIIVRNVRSLAGKMAEIGGDIRKAMLLMAISEHLNHTSLSLCHTSTSQKFPANFYFH